MHFQSRSVFPVGTCFSTLGGSLICLVKEVLPGREILLFLVCFYLGLYTTLWSQMLYRRLKPVLNMLKRATFPIPNHLFCPELFYFHPLFFTACCLFAHPFLPYISLHCLYINTKYKHTYKQNLYVSCLYKL